ncbi:MAG: hypothetical protein JRJ87_11515, partial [Deltaproteobacteria bacterium]|nr:hypothetical protein [Deltaproteobacteria bacterium]
MDFIFMTSRADAGNAYIYRSDGTLHENVELTLLPANSSITVAADAFWLVHTGQELQGFNLMGDMEWYAILGDTHMTWITSSPTIAPGAIVYVLEFTDYDAFTGRLLAIQGSAELFQGTGAYPKFRGDWWNTGWGF